MKLNGKTAIVTGAGNGIGKATANRLGGEAAKVAVVDINQENVDQVTETIRSSGEIAKPLIVGVTKNSEVKAAVTDVLTDFGKINILINCAGADYLVDGGRTLGPRGVKL